MEGQVTDLLPVQVSRGDSDQAGRCFVSWKWEMYILLLNVLKRQNSSVAVFQRKSVIVTPKVGKVTCRRPVASCFCREKRHAPMYLSCVPALQSRLPWPFPSCCKLLITHGL